MRARDAIDHTYEILDRSPFRPLLAATASAVLTARQRSRCAVRYQETVWHHHFADVYLAAPTPLLKGPHEWERTFRDFWASGYMPKAGDVVVDVGAGIGTEVVTLQSLVGTEGKVIAVEAFEPVYRCLDRTVRRNRWSNVRAYNVAVTDHEGDVRMAGSTRDHVGSAVTTSDTGSLVRATTLDSLLQGESRIDWLKMNIEGAEREALAGMEALVPRLVHAVVSCHDFLADEGGPAELRTHATVERWFVDHGFTVKSRATDPRPWIRYQVVASRPPS